MGHGKHFSEKYNNDVINSWRIMEIERQARDENNKEDEKKRQLEESYTKTKADVDRILAFLDKDIGLDGLEKSETK